jgi:hypothetical protein
MEITIPEEHLKQLDELRQLNNIEWNDFFRNMLARKEELVPLTLPLNMGECIAKNTLRDKLSMWADNIKQNMTTIDESMDVIDLKNIKDTHILIIGNGQSYKDHLDDIKKFQGIVMCCEINLVPLLKAGIIPNYVMSLDGEDLLCKHMEDPIINKYADKTTGVFAATVHPGIIERWPGKMAFMTPWLDDMTDLRSITKVMQMFTKKTVMRTGGNVGSFMWFVAAFMEPKSIAMIGLDFAYPAATTPYLHDTHAWDMLKQFPKEEILKHYCRKTTPAGVEVITETTFDTMAGGLISWIRSKPEIRTIQLSECSIVIGDGIELMDFEDYLKEQAGGDDNTN